jgi:hypothetical protein
MSESKELLEATIKGLQEKVVSVQNDLRTKEKELEDVNKPVMTDVMFEKLTQLVEDAISEVSIDESDLEYAMEIDYDNKINLYDVSLNDPSHFADKIMSTIDLHYKIEGTPA